MNKREENGPSENKKLKSKDTCKMEYLVGLRCYR